MLTSYFRHILERPRTVQNSFRDEHHEYKTEFLRGDHDQSICVASLLFGDRLYVIHVTHFQSLFRIILDSRVWNHWLDFLLYTPCQYQECVFSLVGSDCHEFSPHNSCNEMSISHT
jgi:hypothetical protein